MSPWPALCTVGAVSCAQAARPHTAVTGIVQLCVLRARTVTGRRTPAALTSRLLKTRGKLAAPALSLQLGHTGRAGAGWQLQWLEPEAGMSEAGMRTLQRDLIVTCQRT